jgi:hypothetical protein
VAVGGTVGVRRRVVVAAVVLEVGLIALAFDLAAVEAGPVRQGRKDEEEPVCVRATALSLALPVALSLEFDPRRFVLVLPVH